MPFLTAYILDAENDCSMLLFHIHCCVCNEGMLLHLVQTTLSNCSIDLEALMLCFDVKVPCDQPNGADCMTSVFYDYGTRCYLQQLHQSSSMTVATPRHCDAHGSTSQHHQSSLRNDW